MLLCHASISILYQGMSIITNYQSFLPAPTSEVVFPHRLGSGSAPPRRDGNDRTFVPVRLCKKLGCAAAALTNETAVDMAFHEFLWFAKYDVEQPIMLYYCWLWNRDLIWISLMLMNIFTLTSKGTVGSSSKWFSSRVFKFWCVPQNRNLSGLMSKCATPALFQGKHRGWHGWNKEDLAFCQLSDSCDKLSSAVRSYWRLGRWYGGQGQQHKLSEHQKRPQPQGASIKHIFLAYLNPAVWLSGQERGITMQS